VEGRTGYGAHIAEFTDLQYAFHSQPLVLDNVGAVRKMPEKERVAFRALAGTLYPSQESRSDKYP